MVGRCSRLGEPVKPSHVRLFDAADAILESIFTAGPDPTMRAVPLERRTDIDFTKGELDAALAMLFRLGVVTKRDFMQEDEGDGA